MASLKDAIRAKCKDCCYDPLDHGTYLQQIENCNVKSCALWPVRPMTVATINLVRKSKTVSTGNVEIDIDSIINDLEDDETEAVA